MLKVICIDGDWESGTRWGRFKEWLFGRRKKSPVERGIYTVVDSYEEEAEQYYVLAEFDNKEGWEASGFAPLSDIDEMEMVREESKPLTN